jgi:ElaB/YqjD/DUF883 family membrane-anchored ribosome-binding protein
LLFSGVSSYISIDWAEQAMTSTNEAAMDELRQLKAEFETLAKAALAAAGQQAGGVAAELNAGLQSARDRPWLVVGMVAVVAFLLGVAVARRD